MTAHSTSAKANSASDADAARALLAPIRVAMQKYPRCTFEFLGRYFLVYEQWKLLPDRRLAELEKICTEISAPLRAARHEPP